MARTGTAIAYAAQMLKRGWLVAIPTETVYGLAGNGLNEHAVTHIFQVKNRPSFDPMILHTSDLDKLSDHLHPIPKPLQLLALRFMPGPLSILVPKKDSIPDIVTAGSSKVAVRIPNHPMTMELLSVLEFPLAAPSANPFGYISPTTPDHVQTQLGDKIPYILDGGPCRVGLESTIVDFRDDRVVVLRKGGITVEAIESVVGKVEVLHRSTSQPAAPGMLESHYAPRIPLVIRPLDEVLQGYDPDRVGLLTYTDRVGGIPDRHQFLLSESGDLEEAAFHLFSYMRKLDTMDLDIIVAELVPETGLGRAINDKLRRAST